MTGCCPMPSSRHWASSNANPMQVTRFEGVFAGSGRFASVLTGSSTKSMAMSASSVSSLSGTVLWPTPRIHGDSKMEGTSARLSRSRPSASFEYECLLPA